MACRVSRVLATVAISLCTFSLPACDDYDDTELWNTVNDHESRLEALEQWQAEVNNNIAALQTLLNTNDMITSVTPVTMGDETVGYTISFLHSYPITIYNGTQGEQGEAGDTPQIGLTQGDDGNWYWTLNGELMTDTDGNPIRANGEDGKDGQDGQDGQDGADGEDGADGSTGPQGPAGADAPKPQIMLGKDVTGKIETDGGSIIDDAWYLSVDNGATWHRVSGKDGTSGNSLFQSVTKDKKEGYVIFTLSDNTEIKVPLYQGITITFTSGGTTLDPNEPITITSNPQDISYTVTGIEDAKLSAIPSAEGWSATVEDNAIIVTVTTETANECDLLVTATDNAGQSVSYTLSLQYDYLVDEDTYIVTNETGLKAWAEAVQNDLSLNCTLTADITLTGEWTPIGIDDKNQYTGTFNGGGHTITGLTVNQTRNYVGLIGCIGSDGTVKNVKLENVNITGDGYFVGGVAGTNYGTIENCSVDGTLTNYVQYLGGVVGDNYGSIIGCSSSGTITGTGPNVGGIGGQSVGGTIMACYSVANIKGRSSSGGVLGQTNRETVVIACYHAKGNVTGEQSRMIGGVIGWNYGKVTACYWENNQGQGIGDNQGSTTIETTKVDGNWTEAMNAMNNALSGTSWKYVSGSGNEPLMLQKQS